ncbi:hypothetical protein [Nocardia brasiliensis]|uniref:hypothetical protein n=1 Tax=Nocardia brasiliensis TaxID=37326 RepID=UPI00366D8D25
MAEQHLPPRATGPARALGVLVLLAGIVAMHAVVFAMSGHAAAHSEHGATAGPGGGHTAEMATAATGSDRMLALRTDTALEPTGPPDGHELAAALMPPGQDLDTGPVPHGHDRDAAPIPRGHDLDAGPVPRGHDLDAAPIPHGHERDAGPVRHSHDLNQLAGVDGNKLAPTTMPAAVAIGKQPMSGGNSGAAGADCAGDGCGGLHGGMHGCVFILAAAALAFALVLLYRMADRPGNGVTPLRHPRPRRERSPPWTVLSLAELSILRI